MAETVASQGTRYPLPVYNFRVTVQDTTMGFVEVSGLRREYETLTYKHGLSYWEGESIVRFHYDKYVELILKKGVIAKVGQLYEWLASGASRSLSVSLCDAAGMPVVVWKIKKAIAVKLEAPALQASSNEAAIETLTLMVAGMSVERP